MQLKSAIAALSLLALLYWTTPAQADGSVTLRGAYYKERSTRVVQPMLDADLDVSDDGQLKGHLLLDAITSASAASGAAGSAFTETRSEGGLVYMHRFGDIRIGGGVRHSTEPDYQSTYVSARFESEFAQKNATLALNLARGDDSIDNSGSQGGLGSILTGSLSTTMISASFSQVLSPQSILGLSYDLSFLDGFQENIYRTVVAGGMIEPERVPETRLRQSVATTLRYYLEATDTALIASYRFYTDDWGVLASSPEIRSVQELLDGDIEVHLSYRHHRQRGADFYKDVYDSNDMSIEPYLTDDDKLGRMRGHMGGLKANASLGLFGVEGTWGEARVEALVQYIRQDTHYGNALMGQAALTFPVDY